MRQRGPLVGSLAFLSLFLLFCAGPPGFRDGAHFYGPLFEYLQSELAAGRLPLWNPYENLGQPLAANPTTMLFYPGTWLALAFTLLPGLDSTFAYTFFAASHFFLAFLFTYRLSRCWGCSREAAALAGLCYTLGGGVLFQWNNVPFLVGAAWFPEALRLGGSIESQRTGRTLPGFALVLALMVFGGEPQAAFHAVLCSGVFIILKRKHVLHSLAWLLAAALTAILLAAVQILPALELGLLSDRMLESHRNWAYHFSLPPWRLLELYWPNAGGWQFPVHARWFSALPGDQEIWVPSHYMGFFAAILATLMLFCKTKAPRWKAIKILLLFFVLGSLGNACFVYPFLDMLPGYGMFRYPAKLMTPASLMIALLAARGFDRLQWDRRFRKAVQRILLCYCMLILFLIIYMVGALVEGFQIFPSIPACPLFGPFDGIRAFVGILLSVGSVLLFVLLTLIVIHTHGSSKLLLAFLAVELVVANAWMLATVPNNESTDSTRQFRFTSLPAHGAVPPRVYRFPAWYPKEFETTNSENRLAEIIEWDRRSLFHRYPLPLRINMMDVPGTLLEKNYAPILGEMRKNIADGETERLLKRLAWLGVDDVVAPGEAELDAELLFRDKDLSFWKLWNTEKREYFVYEPNRLVFDTDLAEPGPVIVREQYWPGWRAFLEDGTEIPVTRTEKVFRGVEVPAGKQRITMVYDPPLLKIGAGLSLLGLMLLSLQFHFGYRRSGAAF